MTLNGWLQIAVYVLLILAVTKPLGIFMARVFAGERTFLTPVLAPIERGLYALAGVDAKREQHWTTYSFALLLFSVATKLISDPSGIFDLVANLAGAPTSGVHQSMPSISPVAAL